MVPRDKGSSKSFWESRAAQMLTAALYDVCLNPDAQPSKERTMAAVVDWFSSSEEQLKAVKLRLQASPVRVLRRTGDKLDSADLETLDNVMQTVLSHIEPWGWPQIEPLTARTTLDLASFRERNGTLYLCVTERELLTYRPIIRTLLGQILYTLRDDTTRWGLAPVTFFLDEFPQLGYMQEVEQMLALGRQPGLRLWFFSQTLNQLEDAYGKADKILDMVAARCYIAPTGALAERVSKELGSVTDIFTDTARPLATPQELAGPAYANKVIVLEGGRRPARLNLVMAYNDPDLRGRGKFNA
jgi:type IV secretory pathway TraG/TraD family ATPase VirD4